MIPKITPRELTGSLFPPSALQSRDPEGGGFQAILESRLAAPSPPEGLVLSLLLEIINKIMAKGEMEPPPVPLFSLSPNGEEPARGLLPAGPAAPEEKPLERPSPVPGRQDIDRRIQEAAAKHGVEADLIRAVIEVESGFNPRAVSPVGAQGLMQLMPATSADLGVPDPFDPGRNIEGGTRYLKQLLERYGGNRRLALAAYNWGMGNLEKRPEALPRETQRYLVKVEKAYQRYAGAIRTGDAARV